jgi:Holliday junction DNA helicase RuvA
MIGRLAGTLLSKTPPQVLLDVGGVGYEVDVPMSTFYDLPASGERVVLLTHLSVREDAHLLYGFLTESERGAFRELIRISGVGPRLALAVLSGLSVQDLAHAVAAQEPGRLTKIPGIGKKTAERLLLELKGRLGENLAASAGATAGLDHTADIVRALLALGYSEREASTVARGLPAEASVSDGIKQALQRLARG